MPPYLIQERYEVRVDLAELSTPYQAYHELGIRPNKAYFYLQVHLKQVFINISHSQP